MIEPENDRKSQFADVVGSVGEGVVEISVDGAFEALIDTVGGGVGEIAGAVIGGIFDGI